MNVNGTVYYKDKFKKVTEFDQICPKYKTSQYTHKKGSRTFEINATENSVKYTHTIQNSYMCSVCGSSWKSLPYSKENKKLPKKYVVSMRLADLYLYELSSSETVLSEWFIVWFVITILLLNVVS